MLGRAVSNRYTAINSARFRCGRNQSVRIVCPPSYPRPRSSVSFRQGFVELEERINPWSGWAPLMEIHLRLTAELIGLRYENLMPSKAHGYLGSRT